MQAKRFAMIPKFTCCLLLSIFLFAVCHPSIAQDDPEFQQKSITHVRLHSGMITTFHRGVDGYVVGAQLVQQWGIVPNKLRLGAIAGGFYAAQKMDAQAGPTLSWRLKTFNANPFGSAANLHLSIDHLWGTDKQKLIGGGLHIDLLNKLVLGITAHKDYEYKTWWLQTAVGLRISKIKKTAEPFNN